MFTKKILCLGNNSYDTDQKVSVLATQNQTINHGLISSVNFMPTMFGYYHTTVIDLHPGEIIRLSKHFNVVMLLDQSSEEWSHPTLFSTTMKLIWELKELGREIIFQNPKITESNMFFNELLETNKSFCIYPFTLLTSAGNEVTSACVRSGGTPITKIKNLTDWQNDPGYQKIRTKMLAGEKIPEHCSYCYNLEKDGGKGVRYFDTIDWATRLGLTSLDDLKKITTPVHYEIRPSNKCNLKCRSCIPRHSHLIDQEFKNIGITLKSSQALDSYTGFDLVKFDNLKRLYVAGGEPTIMPELYDFLRKCIDNNQTDFEFIINTNATKISDKLFDLFKHFSNLGFSVSFDGVGKVHDYLRYPSKFDEVIKNTHTLIQNGHHMGFITVVSIYNITSLYEIMEFQDREFPGASVMLQYDTFENDIQSPYNHPNVDLVLKSLERCKQTNAYYDYSRGTKSIIDTLYNHYSTTNNFDHVKLKAFFEFNNKLDRSRNQRLADYIPELAETFDLVI